MNLSRNAREAAGPSLFRIHFVTPDGRHDSLALTAESPAAARDALLNRRPDVLVNKVKLDRTEGSAR